jgi:hypothetical protein
VKVPLLLIALALLAACSDGKPPPTSVANPTPSLADQKDAVPPKPAPEQADMAATEMAEPKTPVVDVCDLTGYDMSKMTVDQHEELVKRCARSKQ